MLVIAMLCINVIVLFMVFGLYAKIEEISRGIRQLSGRVEAARTSGDKLPTG